MAPSPRRARRKAGTSVAVKGALSGEIVPPAQAPAPPPTPRRISLRDVDAIRREMGQVYRDARRGAVETSEAARLVYMLSEIRKTYEVSVLERRLAALEIPHVTHT
jgi:hypothetical protein